MTEERVKNISDILPYYDYTPEQLMELIKGVVCKYYEVTVFDLETKMRTKPLPIARQMYYIFVLSLVKEKNYPYIRIAKTINQKHSMVVWAKKLMDEIDQPWNKERLVEYNEIVSMIELEIRSEFKIKCSIKQPDRELVSLLTDVIDVVTKEPVDSEAKKKVIDVMRIWQQAEEAGIGADLINPLLRYKHSITPHIPNECIKTPA